MTRTPIANIGRLNAAMDEHGLDAVVARSGVNFTYLSGVTYQGTLARHLDLADSPRPVFLVWPRRGEPVAVLNPLADALTRRDSWIERVVVYTSYADEPVDKLAEALRELGLQDARVGIEESYFGPALQSALAGKFPKLRMTECTAIMDRVRWIKTPGEIALIRRAADLLDDAFLEVFSALREGDTEREAHSRMVAACLRDGAGFAHGWMATSRNRVPAGGQSAMPFRRGDVVRTDYVAYLDGYPGHQSRNAVLGAPTAAQVETYARVRDIYLATMERCRPGVAVGDVYAFVAERFAAARFGFKAALVGHSVGCWWHQQEPIMAPGNRTPLEAGMVVALEPYVDEWITQDMVVITERGAELLSGKFKTDTLFVAGA